MKDIGDILEQIIAHKPAAHNLLRADLSRNGEDFLRIQLNHLPILILADHREKV